MVLYLRIDDKKDLEWLKLLIGNSLTADPNNQKFQLNFPHLYAWNKYLTENIVTANDIADVIPEKELPTILAKEDMDKVKRKRQIKQQPEAPKRRGRPPKKMSKAEMQRRTSEQRAKEKQKKIKQLEEDPFKCVNHPTYGGSRRPRTECENCWDIYKHFHPHDWQRVWAAFQREQKKK